MTVPYGIPPALAHLLIPALIIINAWHPVCVKVKCQSDYFYTSACLPALMQTLWIDIPGLHIVNLAEMVPRVIRNTENVD